jgi:hypothetical protein
MGSQVMEVAVWLWSLAIVSVFLGLVFNVLRGLFDGYMDKWEEKYLVNEKAEYLEENILSVNDPLPGEDDDDPFNDPDVLDFLERADEQGPWDEQYDKSYTVGGLTADEDKSFMEFQNKMDERDKQLGGDSGNIKNVDDEKEE